MQISFKEWLRREVESCRIDLPGRESVRSGWKPDPQRWSFVIKEKMASRLMRRRRITALTIIPMPQSLELIRHARLSPSRLPIKIVRLAGSGTAATNVRNPRSASGPKLLSMDPDPMEFPSVKVKNSRPPG
jgi:hypothetical protein